MRRVLIVEDHEDVGSALFMMVKGFGHEAFLARTGKAAILATEQFRPDVILMDIELPDMDGLETTRRIRSAHPGTPISIIALTVRNQMSDIAETRAAGMDFHLMKPINPETLRAMLDLPDSPRQ